VHDYLGMKIDYNKPGKVEITMTESVKNMLTDTARGYERDSFDTCRKSFVHL
jgi:hypothetical protein